MLKKFKTFLKKITLSHILNIVFAIAILTIVFNPSAKAMLIRGLMKIGLFQPDVTQSINKNTDGLPSIVLEDSAGKSINLTALKGKVVFINFWATWCPPCVAEMPSINSLYNKLKGNKNIVFLMIDTDSDLKKSDAFMTSNNYNLPLYQTNSEIPENYIGSTIPATLIIDKAGKVVFRHVGAGDYNTKKMLTYLTELAK